MRLEITTATTSMVVPTSDLRDHVRGSTADNDLIQSYAIAAQHYCEDATRRSFFRQDYRLTLDAWHDPIYLPRSPVVSSTGSTGGFAVSYLASGSTSWTSWDTSHMRLLTGEGGRIVKRYGESFPGGTLETGEAVRVDFTAGSTAVVEEDKQMVRLLAGTWYENRESIADVTLAKVPDALRALIWMRRV